MFAVNDYVIYGGNGVCKVEAIGTPKLSGIDKNALYYVLSTVGVPSSTTIYVPVDNPKVAIRKITSKEEAEKLIDSILTIENICDNDDKNRDKDLNQAVNSCDCRDWIKVIKTMHQINKTRNSRSKNKSHIGETYIKAAREKLLGEFSFSLGMPKKELDAYIADRVKAMESRQAAPDCN